MAKDAFSTGTTNLPIHNLPFAMLGVAYAPGVYSIHFNGEAEGEVSPWDGQWARDLADIDVDRARNGGHVPPKDLPTIHVDILLLDSDGYCFLLDSVTLRSGRA